uniref:Uncharacterized protein n=1 Tax=Sphaerodactylus townsendi TaxID=933632 RepID=A0ACB8FKT4_9SAUR
MGISQRFSSPSGHFGSHTLFFDSAPFKTGELFDTRGPEKRKTPLGFHIGPLKPENAYQEAAFPRLTEKLSNREETERAPRLRIGWTRRRGAGRRWREDLDRWGEELRCRQTGPDLTQVSSAALVPVLAYVVITLPASLPLQHLHIKTLTDDVMDRFASIRIPGSKKDRPPQPHLKHSSTSDWPVTPDGDAFIPTPLPDREILTLFEKMMEDMNLNEGRKVPLREKDFNTKKEMVMQYVSSKSKAGSLKSNKQITPQDFICELKSGTTDERLVGLLESLRVSLTSNPVRFENRPGFKYNRNGIEIQLKAWLLFTSPELSSWLLFTSPELMTISVGSWTVQEQVAPSSSRVSGWVESFGHEGLGLLLDILEKLVESKQQDKILKKVQHKIIQCMKAFMNNQYGLERIMGEQRSLSLLAKTIDPKHTSMMTDVVKLLSAICIVGEENILEKILEALTAAAEERSIDRFFLIVEGLRGNSAHLQVNDRFLCGTFIGNECRAVLVYPDLFPPKRKPKMADRFSPPREIFSKSSAENTRASSRNKNAKEGKGNQPLPTRGETSQPQHKKAAERRNQARQEERDGRRARATLTAWGPRACQGPGSLHFAGRMRLGGPLPSGNGGHRAAEARSLRRIADSTDEEGEESDAFSTRQDRARGNGGRERGLESYSAHNPSSWQDASPTQLVNLFRQAMREEIQTYHRKEHGSVD